MSNNSKYSTSKDTVEKLSEHSLLVEQLVVWEKKDSNEPKKALAKSILNLVNLYISENISLQAEHCEKNHKDTLIKFLNITGKSDFLMSLSNRKERYFWAETACNVIRRTEFGLKELFESRVSEKPKDNLFIDTTISGQANLTYEMTNHKVREIATSFYSVSEKQPKVAIISENNSESACCDLACLFYDIVDTTLNVHFDTTEFKDILVNLDVNIVVTDTEERYNKFKSIREKGKLEFNIFVLDDKIITTDRRDYFLNEYCKKFNRKKIDDTLNRRTKRNLDDIATFMFTSGNTGQPKGVSFTYYNLISKRFARAAALPKVGNDEVLLCFLPLYHTFGRFLEMLGSIYWGGTYVFTGNPSAETLLSLFPKVNPTGFISIPLRWTQLMEKYIEEMSVCNSPEQQIEAFRKTAGTRLRWGLSAAGYLNPKVFKFFESCDVELCSGFGMTEATGGITMTPPGEYVNNSVGIPLPCIKTKLNKKNELLISGDYIAKYYEFSNAPELDSKENQNDNWIATGDIFHIDRQGYYYIVDRVKDIYKNNKGQTIAPKKVENKFSGVPGIKRTFLVGDGREYNVLFIVPDYEEPVLKVMESKQNPRDYFHRIVSAANEQLATYERVINFSLLKRDFDISHNELTAKGSYKRKNIEENFSEEIDELYKSNYIDLEHQGLIIKIPRWFYRNLGVLEDDIILNDNGLFNKGNNTELPFKLIADRDRFLIGDLEYIIYDSSIDFGLLIRQPRLWAGNPSLIAFYPCIDRWDLNTGSVSTQVFLPIHGKKNYSSISLIGLQKIRDKKLVEINKLICETLFSDEQTALIALQKIGNVFEDAGMRIKELIRRRLEALARHPFESIRCTAYRILLMEEPNPDYSKAFPAFVKSGLTFLNNDSINNIALSKLGKRRLEALRQRMMSYRNQLDWPASEETWMQFTSIFKLMVDFAQFHPEFYSSVRAELTSWITHKYCTELSDSAKKLFKILYESYEKRIIKETQNFSTDEWEQKLIFENNLSLRERKTIKKVLIGTAFLEESIILAFDEHHFTLENVSNKGIWISKVESDSNYRKYRFSINTLQGKHFDLLVTLYNGKEKEKTLTKTYWHAAISGYPFYPRVLPRLGCCRPNLGAISTAYNSELTAWEKIRELSGSRTAVANKLQINVWRKLYIRAIVAFLLCWRNSGYKIIPGPITPGNVVVPELDFHVGSTILSLSGFADYSNSISLIKPIIYNFYFKTIAHYPWCFNELDIKWIFDAYIEAFGKNEAGVFLNTLYNELDMEALEYPIGSTLKDSLESYLNNDFQHYYLPLPLLNSIERYKNWEMINPQATATAKEETINELYRLYHLYEYPEISRYYLYLLTYFSDAKKKTRTAFDKLLKRMENEIEIPATNMIELSDLQNVISTEEDRAIFSRMIFPHSERRQKVDVSKTDEEHSDLVVVKTFIKDNYNSQFTIRRPVDPAEIGQLYRLFYLENYPKTISDSDKYY